MKLFLALLVMVAILVIPWPKDGPGLDSRWLHWPAALGLGCVLLMIGVMIEVTWKGLDQSKSD